jgi:hypothetical protein
LNAIINANKEQFVAIARRSSPGTVFLIVTSTRTRELAAGRMLLPALKVVPFQQTAPSWGSMFDHVLSSALSTVFDLAFAVLPAAPLFAVKRLSSFTGPEQAQKKAQSENPAASTVKSA